MGNHKGSVWVYAGLSADVAVSVLVNTDGVIANGGATPPTPFSGVIPISMRGLLMVAERGAGKRP